MSFKLNLTAALGLIEWSDSFHPVKMTVINAVMDHYPLRYTVVRLVCRSHEYEKRILKSKMNILLVPSFHACLSPFSFSSHKTDFFFLLCVECWLTWFAHLLLILCVSNVYKNQPDECVKGRMNIANVYVNGEEGDMIVPHRKVMWLESWHCYASHKIHFLSHDCEMSWLHKQSFERYMLFSVLSRCLKLVDVTGRESSASLL